MKFKTHIAGKTFESYNTPNMGQQRKYAEISTAALKAQSADNTKTEDLAAELTSILVKRFDLVLSAFPDMKQDDLDKMQTDAFNMLFKKVSTWILSGGTKTENVKNQ